MGCFNSLMAAFAGYQAVLFDVSKEVLDGSAVQLREMASFLASQGFFYVDDIPGAIERVSLCDDLAAAVADAQLISESVSENIQIKRQVHSELDVLCAPATIITTNTSNLLVSDIEGVFKYGERFAALHSHLGSRLFDIVGGKRTSAATIQRLERYVLSIGGEPLLLDKENPGYVLNAMLGPLLTAALVLVIEQRATIEEVDRAWMVSQGAPIGPFGLMDLFGLNVIFDSWQQPKERAAGLQTKIVSFITPYVQRHDLGVKTGKGFYSYPDPAYSLATFQQPNSDLNHVIDVLQCALIGSALLLDHNGIASRDKINSAWRSSLSLQSGPFDAYESMGIEQYLRSHQGLVELELSSHEAARLAR